MIVCYCVDSCGCFDEIFLGNLYKGFVMFWKFWYNFFFVGGVSLVGRVVDF